GAERPRTAKPASRRGRRRKDDGGDKELFAFYEQSLF
ncbi:MAG TPA: MerR family transcriptional regulator, partial [Alistipes sp.]|nr:MerR family transcriptional regulator [Alistipes sp.]